MQGKASLAGRKIRKKEIDEKMSISNVMTRYRFLVRISKCGVFCCQSEKIVFLCFGKRIVFIVYNRTNTGCFVIKLVALLGRL